MPYTVSEAYTKVLQECDKMGSDYFTLAEVLSRFKKCTLDFVGQRAAEVEKTQMITDDIKPLVKMTKVTSTVALDELQTYQAALPNDYHTRLGIRIQYPDLIFAREPYIERVGEHGPNMVNPYRKPEKHYPLVRQFSNFFKISTGGGAIPFFYLTYIKQPTFGSSNPDIIVDLPDQVVEDIIAMTVNSLFVSTGDPRAQVQFQVKETSRKPRN